MLPGTVDVGCAVDTPVAAIEDNASSAARAARRMRNSCPRTLWPSEMVMMPIIRGTWHPGLEQTGYPTRLPPSQPIPS